MQTVMIIAAVLGALALLGTAFICGHDIGYDSGWRVGWEDAMQSEEQDTADDDK